MPNEKTKKVFKKGSWKVPKSFWRRKGKKRQNARKQYRNLSEEENQKSVNMVADDIENF